MIEILKFCTETESQLYDEENDMYIFDEDNEYEIDYKNLHITITINSNTSDILDYSGETELSFLRHDFESDFVTPLTIIELFDYIIEVKQGKIINNLSFISPKKALFYVEGDTYKFSNYPFVDFCVKQKWENATISVQITQKITPFGLKLLADGQYDEYFPSIISDDNFVMITSDKNLSLESYLDILGAYLFELNSSYDVTLYNTERITCLDEKYWYDELNSNEDDTNLKIRKLLSGKGISQLLALFNQAHTIVNHEYRILTYTKIIEYVSLTVVRKDMLNKTLTKLNSARVLRPDASYILELEQIFDDSKNNKKDSHSIRLAINTCCDIYELRRYIPQTLNIVDKKLIDSDLLSEQEKNSYLDKLANVISDTRNMIAHAKTNYKLKGNECPAELYPQFADCMRIIAIQLIRWFSMQHEDSRIV